MIEHKPQPDRSGVPSTCREPTEQPTLRGVFIEMELLRIVATRELQDLVAPEHVRAERGDGADLQILEVVAHDAAPGARTWKNSAAFQVMITSPFWFKVSNANWQTPTSGRDRITRLPVQV